MNAKVLLLFMLAVVIVGGMMVVSNRDQKEHDRVLPDTPAALPASATAPAPPEQLAAPKPAAAAPIDPSMPGVPVPPPGARMRANGPAAPDLSNPENRFIELMKYDLRALTMVEEMYFAEQTTYTNDLKALQNFRPQPGVTIDITTAGQTGWAAVAHHKGAPSQTCAVFVGNVSAPRPAKQQAQVACSR